MTFDARGGSSSSPGIGQVGFGAAVLAVVGGAFALTLMWPGSPASPHKAAFVSADATQISAKAFGASGRDYFNLLEQVEPAAYVDLAGKLSGATSEDDAFETVMAHGAELLVARADDLAHTPTVRLDAMMDLTRSHLRAASMDRSRWCVGQTYIDMQATAAAPEQMMAEVQAPLQDYAFEMMEALLMAADAGRATPARRSQVTSQDELALQGAGMSVLSDPQVMPLILGAQGGADMDALTAELNVCDLASTAVLAIKTLPQDTKGRLWTRLINDAPKDAKGLADLATAQPSMPDMLGGM